MRLLQRAALQIPAIRRLHESRNALASERDVLLRERVALDVKAEESAKEKSSCSTSELGSQTCSPFFHFNTVFDAKELILRNAVPDLKPRAGYLTNFLGVVIDPKFFPQLLEGRAGQVEGVPIPGNWHADMAEFAAALRAVDLAEGSFTIIELGCGWGCWMNNTGVVARRKGLVVKLVGVEGDEGHTRFAEEAIKANGFLAGCGKATSAWR